MIKKEKTLYEEQRTVLTNYCLACPISLLAKISDGGGEELAIEMMVSFQGKIVAFPTRNALRRLMIPVKIQKNLFLLLVGSDEFKKRVKQLSKTYKLPKRAIMEMNKTGKYTR